MTVPSLLPELGGVYMRDQLKFGQGINSEVAPDGHNGPDGSNHSRCALVRRQTGKALLLREQFQGRVQRPAHDSRNAWSSLFDVLRRTLSSTSWSRLPERRLDFEIVSFVWLETEEVTADVPGPGLGAAAGNGARRPANRQARGHRGAGSSPTRLVPPLDFAAWLPVRLHL
jgi:hypothetical protein